MVPFVVVYFRAGIRSEPDAGNKLLYFLSVFLVVCLHGTAYVHRPGVTEIYIFFHVFGIQTSGEKEGFFQRGDQTLVKAFAAPAIGTLLPGVEKQIVTGQLFSFADLTMLLTRTAFIRGRSGQQILRFFMSYSVSSP